MRTHIALTSLVFLMVLLPFRPMQAQLTLIAANNLENNPARQTNFPDNSLVLNDNPLDYNLFTIYSRGKLAVVSGDPTSEEATPVPFRIYLRRNGMIIQKGASDPNRQQCEIEVSTVLALALPGDELVIDPARQADSSARRIIPLKGLTWLLFPKSGC